MSTPSAVSFERPLSAAAMRRVMTDLMDGRLGHDEIAVFLSTLARRGETAEELAAAVEVVRARAVRLPLSKRLDLCDTCGTGGDQQGTINVSTLAALVAASAGVRVAKHGNRAASSRCGSADLLEALGVNLDATPQEVARCIEETGFGFCFAPRFHPAMKIVAPVRKALGIRTIFNLIGPLANPAPLTYQLVGVAEPRLLRSVAEALVRLGIRHGLVVHGSDGLDEVTITGPTQVVEVRDGHLVDQTLEPEACGVRPGPLDAVRGGEPDANAELARRLLDGAQGPATEIVILNAGCAIYAADQTGTVREGVARAREALASGRTRELLRRVQELTA